MLKRYTHPTEQRKAEALDTFTLDTNRSQATRTEPPNRQ